MRVLRLRVQSLGFTRLDLKEGLGSSRGNEHGNEMDSGFRGGNAD